MNAGAVFNLPGRRGILSAAAAAALGVGGTTILAPTVASARTQSITEDVRLSLVKKSGLSFDHRGTAKGTIPGSVRSKMTMDGLTISGTVTVAARGGSLRIKVRGTARSGGLRTKFDGTANVAGGTGRFRKARGNGRFSGVVNRQTWAATLRATGTLVS
jgi:hypothetical protein